MLETLTIEPARRFIIPPRDGAARVEDRAQVRLDHRAPVVVAHAREKRVAGHARVVDQDVEIAGLLDEPLCVLGGRDIRLHGAPADLARDLPPPPSDPAL